MADAPSGGGSSWGPFEIVLVLLLAIGLLSNIGNKNKTPTVTTETENTVLAPIDDSVNRCGLSITSPLSLEKVYNNVRLSGSVNGCNWNIDGKIALYAQIITATGKPVSDYVSVEENGSSFLNYVFDTTIYLNGPQKGTGYLILVPAVQKGEQTATVRIPLTFVKN